MAWIENQFGDVLLLKQTRGNRSGHSRRQSALARDDRGSSQKRSRRGNWAEDSAGGFSGLFDRSEKAVITFLYSARVKGHHGDMSPKRPEVAAAKFSSSLPTDATPSLRFFWKRLREDTRGKAERAGTRRSAVP